ncbi:hypothetical protein O0Q50_28595 [Priestia aryabhattai]|uniref:Uncharacterized protein n=1 Tax=Priestia aryabhattai TaxID=412384 RepID=A0AAX6NGY0_PRIAR|nr:hypothetical protein [Priestia aryabhattai]MDU9695161.1 hypothetical protein [Priestia aryabhattai]
MSLQGAVEEKLNTMTTDDKDTLISYIAVIVDKVKVPATEDSYTKEQAFDRIVEELQLSGIFG